MFNLKLISLKQKKILIKLSQFFNFFYLNVIPSFYHYKLETLDVSYTGKTYKWSIKQSF